MSLSVAAIAKIIFVESKCITLRNSLSIAKLINDAYQDSEIKDYIESPIYGDEPHEDEILPVNLMNKKTKRNSNG